MQAASTGSGFGWENPVVVPLGVFQEIQDPQPEIFIDFLMIMKTNIYCLPNDYLQTIQIRLPMLSIAIFQIFLLMSCQHLTSVVWQYPVP